MKFKLSDTEFDITLVSIPNIEYLPDEPLEGADVELMMEVLANQEKPSEAMLRILSGPKFKLIYKSNHFSILFRIPFQPADHQSLAE